MNTLVTGGAGFIGSHLAESLLAHGHGVTVVDDLSSGKREYLPDGAGFFELDIAGPDLGRAFEGEPYDLVFHLAAQTDVTTSVANPAADARINLLGALQLLELCRKQGAGKVVFSSSCAVIGEPRALPVDESHPARAICPYGVSKYSLEQYLFYYRAVHGLDYTVLRYGNVYGPRQSASLEGGVIAIFASRMLKGETPTIFGDGEQTRDYVYVGDVVAANLAAMEKAGGQVVHIGHGRPTSVNQIFSGVARALQIEMAPVHGAARAGEVRHIHLSNTLAGELLGWRPAVGLEEGLKRTLDWHRGA